MAFSVRSLLALSSRKFGQTLFRPNIIQGKRFLYTEQSLGILGYEFTRNNFKRQFTNVEDTFRSKMAQVCEEDSSMIFTEDLKAILHLATKDDKDIELIVKMIKKFHKQNQDLRFVMRTFYYLNVPDIALEVFYDDSFNNFFDQFVSYQLLMCLLYKNERYEDMKAVYDRIKEKFVSGNPFPRNAVLLVLAACYKLNDPESFKYATNLWSDLATRKLDPNRRSTSFMAALAINQNSPDIALEVICAIRAQRYIDCRCLKVLANLGLNRLNEIKILFSSSLQTDNRLMLRDMYFYDVIQKTEDVMKEKNPPEAEEIFKLTGLLRSQGQIINTTLDEHLCKPIQIDKHPNNRVRREELEYNTPSKSFSMSKRPSLRDLV